MSEPRRVIEELEHAEALLLATGLVKKAGFVLHHTSLQTETCHYCHPSRPDAYLRVSTHKAKEGPIGLNGIVARLTISRKEDLNFREREIVSRTTFAIGRYFLTDPKPSAYMARVRRLSNQ